MNSRGRARAALLACVLGSAGFVALFAAPVAAQQKDAKKLDKVQMQEAQVLADAIDWAQAGRPLPSDIPLTFDTVFFFKAANGQTYVPFTVGFDPKQFGSPNASYLLRVVKKGAQPVAKKETKKDEPVMDQQVNDLNDLRDMSDQHRAQAEAEKNKKPPVAPATYEDLEFPALSAPKMSRAFQVPAGEYEVYIAMKDRPADKKQKAKVTIFKKEIAVPEFTATPELATSTVIVADKIDALPAPLKPEQQRENPYTIGQLQILPKAGTTFAKNQELNVYFQIYNAGIDASKKPDVLVEYLFYQKQASGEKKVFNSEPTVLNGSSLPPAFDITKHQLAGGGGWPLTSFPTGDYRLEIKVTDKVSGKTLTHSVNFTVA